MARIAGVNLPNQKRLEVGLTYIFGIGRSTAKQIASELGISQDTKVRDLTDDEVTKLRNYIDDKLTVEGDLRRERQQAVKRLGEIGAYRGVRHRRGLPVQRSAHEDQRAHPQGREEDRRTRQEGQVAWRLLARQRPAVARRRRVKKEHRHRPGAHQDVVQQHDRRADRQGRQRDRVGVRRLGRFQGLAQVDPVRRPGHRRQLRARRAWSTASRRSRSSSRDRAPGRETAIRSLQAAGLEILGVKDVTPQAHNGVRQKKRRRV